MLHTNAHTCTHNLLYTHSTNTPHRPYTLSTNIHPHLTHACTHTNITHTRTTHIVTTHCTHQVQGHTLNTTYVQCTTCMQTHPCSVSPPLTEGPCCPPLPLALKAQSAPNSRPPFLVISPRLLLTAGCQGSRSTATHCDRWLTRSCSVRGVWRRGETWFPVRHQSRTIHAASV